jgi:uncharacterized membrane protein
VDLLRGLVMVVMALDHTRSYFTHDTFDPTDLDRTTPALFLTRWVTHFCAPVFVFLAGAGAYLHGSRMKSRAALAGFLLTRGLWLMVLELTVVRLVWFGNLSYDLSVLQVIWAIGASMVVLAGLVFLPTSAVAVVGIALIAFHNLLDGVRPDEFGSLGPLWMVLRSTGFMELWPGVRVVAAYPLLPWLGVLASGYAFGALLRLPPRDRRIQLAGLGLALTLLFVGMRAFNRYGDPRPWSFRAGELTTVLSFVNCNKYPPSLSFLLMTLGPAIAALALLDRPAGSVGRFFIVFGRVPLFYYVLHFALIHALAVAASLVWYGQTAWLFRDLPPQPPEGYGYGLPVVYLVWMFVVAVLYGPCRWFAAVKERRRDWWLSYL